MVEHLFELGAVHPNIFALLQSPDAPVCDNIWNGGPGNSVCEGRTNDCHSCPACTNGLNRLTANSTQIESIFVICVP
jgi:hypothetical protein